MNSIPYLEKVKLWIKVNYTLNNDEVGVYGETGQIVLHKGQGEGRAHVYMKLLSFFMFYHPDLQIERSAGQHYKPDLVRVDYRGRPLQWVDCGATSIKKLNSIATRNKMTTINIIKKTLSELKSYKSQAEKRISHPNRVRYFTFNNGFLEQMKDFLNGTHNLTVTITGGNLYLDIDGHQLETEIIELK